MKRNDVPRAALGRRQFLEASAALAAYGLLPGESLAADVPLEFDGSRFQLAAPEPNPKRGGVLRYAITSRPPHFDVHQSGTINSLGAQGCMFDNLIRRDPRDSGKTIIPDLAHSWQIAPDGKTYTFFLRRDVQFHDGAELTAEDVKATYDRIVKPPSGISIPRSTLFTAVSEINARDKYTIEFKLQEPRPANFIMSAFASGWNVIFRKKTLEENGYNLRRVVNIPGTGPFRSVRRVENEVWVMERNDKYWNKGLPYLDGIEFYHALPFSPELGSALLSGRVDYARIMDPVSNRRVRATPGMSGTDFYQSVIQATWVNAKKKPLDDPRVRRAMHLVLDKAVLVEVVKDVAPMMVGGFIYPFSDFATPRAELTRRLGYQADPGAAVKEARALMAAAGQGRGVRGLDFIVRDVATFKLWAQAIQAMLQQTLNIECRLRTVVESVWFDDVRSGNYDLAIGAVVSTLLDPSDYFNAWYKDGGSQNYSNWSDPRLEPLLPQIDREVDSAKRLALIRQAEAIMEENPPLLPVAWEKIMDGWFNYVKGHVPDEYFGIYDVVRMDTMWLDK
ncbi:peptide ABC transporter substrate-binding protein [Siccirubricoccus deserti]|uniref:ABC transporter substrate-binding protein n=1 Tax=Siccirubricoccus deserti TaxID=2013562 RepID=A0A9X0QY74_9PROT|nr:ABC transporter substrate-binding protein [Siccirubricoccus deserti]MBC4016186.1 ABC transporter substrate-binding protein [Siccirubricoccus deserti]GGC47877.1 peptide ABC transporter substrate-binding protein [Siccirubricoccus deserti]